MSTQEKTFISTTEAIKRYSLSRSTLKKLRLGDDKNPPLIVEGVEWRRFGVRKVLYYVPLFEEFLKNREIP